MPFQKGHSFTKGRPKGALNKTTKVKETIAEVVEAFSASEIIKDLKEMSPNRRVDALQNLYKYLIPTMKAVEIEDNSQDQRNMDYLESLMEIPEENFDKLHG